MSAAFGGLHLAIFAEPALMKAIDVQGISILEGEMASNAKENLPLAADAERFQHLQPTLTRIIGRLQEIHAAVCQGR